MSLLKPSEDFLKRSVRAVRGKVSRLSYIGKLRTSQSDYQHWGMEQSYGKDAAHSAISQAHSTIWHEILSTRIQELAAETRKEALDADKRSQLCWDDSLIPADKGAGTKRHFVFLMKTLNLLLRYPR